MTMLTELIVPPAIQRERAKARRMGSLFLPEPKWEPATALVPSPPQVRKRPWRLVVWITLDEAEAYFPEVFEGIERVTAPQVTTPVEQTFPTFESIFRLVCATYGETKTDIMSQRRTAKVVRPRQILMYLARTLTLMSLPQIGRKLGDRDHTTALCAVRKISALRQSDSKLDAELIFFERELAAG